MFRNAANTRDIAAERCDVCGVMRRTTRKDGKGTPFHGSPPWEASWEIEVTFPAHKMASYDCDEEVVRSVLDS